MHWKFYGDRLGETPLSGGLNVIGVANIAIYWHFEGYISQMVQDSRYVSINHWLYMSFRLVLKSVTLNDLERVNGPYFALFYRSC